MSVAGLKDVYETYKQEEECAVEEVARAKEHLKHVREQRKLAHKRWQERLARIERIGE